MSSKKCHHCGLVNFADAEACKRCGEKLLSARQAEYREQLKTKPGETSERQPSTGDTAVPHPVPIPPNQTKLWLGLAGVCLLWFGSFAPLVSVPVIGSINYFRNGEGDGVVIVVLAFIALVLTLARYHRVVGLIGLVSLLLIGYSFFTIKSRLAAAKEDYELKMIGNEFAGVGRTFMEAVSMEWGWVVLVIGALLLIVSSELPGEKSQAAAASVSTESDGASRT